MYMVWPTAHFDRNSSNSPDDTTNIGEYACEVILSYLYSRTFDVEYQMYVYFHQCACHAIMFLVCRPFRANVTATFSRGCTPAYGLITPSGLILFRSYIFRGSTSLYPCL